MDEFEFAASLCPAEPYFTKREFYARAGVLLRRAREAAFMSQRELGQIIGASQSQVCMIEQGTRGLDADALVAAARALKP